MAERTISNEYLEIMVKDHGAELVSVKKGGRQYLWNADPAYWGRVSPVLFPFVGGLEGKVYRHAGKEYPMTQHGFARDRDFEPVSRSEQEMWFVLRADEETRKVYPFEFELQCGYRLEGSRVEVIWKVKNLGNEEMYFAIGAHPACLCPPEGKGRQEDCSIRFDSEKDLVLTRINEKGMVIEEKEVIRLEDGVMPLEEHTFDRDALVFEQNQAHRVELLDAEKNAYIAVTFDAPLFGVWSPAGKHAPFVCIEPWYGRCDRAGYQGSLADREWENSLAPGGEWTRSYQIEIL